MQVRKEKTVRAKTLAIAACVTAFFDCFGLQLAERGVSGATAIALPANPSESQRYAASELAKYLRAMTGVAVPVGACADVRPAIVFRTSDAFGTDGFELAVKEDALVISGSARRGCLYGVYELLERLGCGFFWLFVHDCGWMFVA